jgi:hypothetical protein
MVGTPLYMSPEQAVGSRDIDTRTDVWSLGVVLYVALTGGEPFRGIDTLGKLILAICSTPIPPVQERAPWVPQELARLVSCALERSPSRRFADAGAMHQALSAWTGSDVTLPLSALTPVSDETRRTVEVRVAEQAASLLSAGELEALLGGGSPDDPGLSTFAGKRALELAEEQADVLATATTMIRGSKPAPSPIEEPTPGPVALAGTRGSRTPWLMALGGAALLGGLAWWQPCGAGTGVERDTERRFRRSKRIERTELEGRCNASRKCRRAEQGAAAEHERAPCRSCRAGSPPAGESCAFSASIGQCSARSSGVLRDR